MGKGQVEILDLFFAIILFLVVVTTFFIVWNLQQSKLDDTKGTDQLEVYTFQFTNQLLRSPGIPDNWEYSMIGSVPSNGVLADVCGIGTEQITNGGFEFPVVISHSLWETYTSVSGWKITWRNSSILVTPRLELQRGVNGWKTNPGDGTGDYMGGYQYVELDSDQGNSTTTSTNKDASTRIYQDITTVPGAQYKLEFSYSPRPAVSNNGIKVTVNDTSTSNIILTNNPAMPSGTGLSNTLWTDVSYSFTAIGTKTRIILENTDVSDSLGTFLDTVSVKCTQNVYGTGFVQGSGGQGSSCSLSSDCGNSTPFCCVTPSGGFCQTENNEGMCSISNTTLNLKALGLSDYNPVLSERKVNAFKNLNYSQILNVSNLGSYNFYFLLKKGNVSVLEIGTYPSGRSVKLRRNVIYQNAQATAEVSLWK